MRFLFFLTVDTHKVGIALGAPFREERYILQELFFDKCRGFQCRVFPPNNCIIISSDPDVSPRGLGGVWEGIPMKVDGADKRGNWIKCRLLRGR